MADLASQPTDLVDEPTGGPATAGASTPDIDPADATADAAADHAAIAELTAAAAESDPDDLLGELARAMHAAATSQYERMNAELERRRSEQVEAIASRANSEAEHLKVSLETDISSIDAWSKAETEKVKHERLRRIDARREQLAGQLDRQATIKEREVFAIEVAIDAHRKEVDLFFGRMERETDPSAIAKVASALPSFPPLAEIADTARRGAAAEFASLEQEAGTMTAAGTAEATSTVAEAGTPPAIDEPEPDPEASVSESRLMAVMDPAASHGGHDGAAHEWDAPSVVSVAAGTGVTEESTEAQAEPASRVGSTLLRTVRAIRPMHDERDTKR